MARIVGPQGSAAHPVRLDHFQRVKEVGWSGIQFVALPLDIARRSVRKDYPYPIETAGEQPWDWASDPEASPLDANPVEPWATEYITGFQYEYITTPTIANAVQVLHKQGWLHEGVQSIDGLSALPDARSVPPWTVVMCRPGDFSTVYSWYPRAEYQPIGGSTIEWNGAAVSVPDHADIAFLSAGSATLQMRGTQFVDGPRQGTGFFGDTTGTTGADPTRLGADYTKYGVTNLFDPRTGAGMDYVFEPLTIDVTAIRVTRGGRSYRGVGAALVPDPAPYPTSPGMLWVLCEKEKTT